MEVATYNGQLILLMAPMGSGKGTLVRHALSSFPDLYVTISCTTRSPRPGEVNGKDYYFITAEDFDAKVAAGDFMEWATFGKHRYGTLKREIVPHLQNCGVVLCEIEIQGVEQLLTLLPRTLVTCVYVEAGGWDVLRTRALARAPMTEDELTARHERFLIEQESKQIADVIIDNSSTNPALACSAFTELITTCYQRCTVAVQ